MIISEKDNKFIKVKQTKMINKLEKIKDFEGKYEKIVLAGGCFWCIEGEFSHVPGILLAISGYTDSQKENPTYEEVSSQRVRAREAVLLYYDKNIIPLTEILERFWKQIDPTDAEGSFADRGYQYTSAVYYFKNKELETIKDSVKELSEFIKHSNNFIKKEITTEILPFENFFPAEEYHQDYKEKNPLRYISYKTGSGRSSFTETYFDGFALRKND
jgi:peptide methionine sulfoxide reductase msrA/msrB